MQRLNQIFLLLAVAGVLLGCASKPGPLGREAAEERFPELAADPAEPVPSYGADWADDFGEPRLIELIETTLEENPDAAAAAARLRAATATTRIVGADRLPSFSAEALGSRGRTVNKIDFPGVGETLQTSTDNRFELGLRMSWEIDLWGRLADARQASLFEEQAAASDLAATRLALSTNVARAWFEASARILQARLAEKQLEVSRKSLRATEDRVNRGLIGSLELSLARSQVESAESTLETAIRTRRNAVRQVQAISGRYPDGNFPVPENLPTLTEPPPEAIPSTVLSRRPDLLAASARISAADSRVSEAEKNLIPTFSLSGSLGTASDELSDLLDSDFTVWNLAGNLLQPVFQGGRLRAEVERREALLAASISDFESVLLTALREVEDALDSDAFLREAAASAYESARLAQQAATVGFDRYERGLIDLLDVLDLQNRAFDAYRQAIDLRLLSLTNRLNLYAALGGGFQPNPESDS